MEETLRYFFSAVFQGFAAIITLGIMFYLYYLDTLFKKVENIENSLINAVKARLLSNEDKIFIEENGVIEFTRQYVLPAYTEKEPYNFYILKISKYDSIVKQKDSLANKIKWLFKIARLILIISLISLFLVDYEVWLNYLLNLAGFVCIVLSIVFFSQLFTFSKEIIDNPI